jgi:aspartate aminotransferase-like enzyme
VRTAGVKLNNYILFTPGPVDVPEDILKAMSNEVVYHREKKFTELFSDTTERLKKVLATEGRIFFFAASGTGAMEAAFSNLMSRSDRPVIAICGKFGQRWLEISNSYGIDPLVCRVDYGKSLDPRSVQTILEKNKKPAVIFATLTETSTGALNDIKTLGKIVRDHGSYLVVDGVAGIAADVCYQDDWCIDILVGASQKALMSPPGISFIAVNERAFAKIEKSNLPAYYFDLRIYEKFRLKNQTPWTPAINVFYGLNIGLEKILKKGLEKTYADHRKAAGYVRERVKKLGLDLLPEKPSNALTVIKIPDNNSTEIIQTIKEKYGILFADGQADLKGSIIRIGHMGNYGIEKLSRALDALETTLHQRGK